MPKLVILNGTEAGQSFDVTAPELVIGRQKGAHILIDGAKVSRRHARVFQDAGQFRLEDLGSSNGTLLNGRKLETATLLNNHDEIGIGASRLRYEDGAISPEFTIRAHTAANTANSDLYQANAAHKLQVILRLSADLGRSLEVDQLLNKLLDHLFTLFPQAEQGLIILLQEGQPFVRAQKQRPGLDRIPHFSSSIVNKVATEGIGIFAEDLQSDTRFAGNESIVSLGIASLMCVPLQTPGGKPLGVLQLERKGQGRQFTAEDLHLLTTIGLQVSVALDNAQLHQELLARQRIEQEVELARKIQLGYLPSDLPPSPTQSFELHTELHPATEISGDFYDFFNIGSDRLAIAVADVCGKGIPAALFMSMVRALLRNLCENQSNPGAILRDLNNAVARQNPNCQFVTLSFAIFDPASLSMELASAGHPPPMIRGQDGSVAPIAIQQGPLLGFENRPEAYPTLFLQLSPGDLVLFYTDGVTEAPSPTGEMFGLDRLSEALAQAPFPAKPSDWTKSLRASIRAFTGNRPQEDDITLALLRVR